MRRRRFLGLVAVFALAAAIPGGGKAPAAIPTLYANVGPGYVMSLTDGAGNPVTSLEAGSYTIVVTDQSDKHNFHLTGPGVDVSTTVAFVGQVTWTVTFAAGSHRFVCDPHDEIMFGSFSVVAPPDTTPPETTISGGPGGAVNAASATFSFAASEPGSSFACALDGSSFTGCSSPTSYTGLVDGSHSFQVRATDAAGNVDPSPATRTWTVDTVPPETAITAGPSGVVSSSAGTFSFSSSEAESTFQCSLDGVGYAACSSPHSYGGLANGAHSFRVRTTDSAGNVDPTSAIRTWTVDSVPPETTITAGPRDLDSSAAPSFEFSASKAGASFECALDGAPFARCSSPQSYGELADGTHTFEVRAADATGNVDPTPAGRTWTIDTAPPEATIDSGPSGTVSSTAASFDFSAGEAGASFECSLDGAAFASCSSPLGYFGLAEGGHTFEVRARDAAGNVDATPARRTWTVAGLDTTAPETTITLRPADPSNATAPIFEFAANEASATFECSLDGAAFAPCSSPRTLGPLTDGSHTFQVRGTDVAGNTDATAATHIWTVDTVAPETSITAGPPDPDSSASARFEFAASEAGASFECSLDGAAFARCSSPKTYSALATGPHTFEVLATDPAGNDDPTPASRLWIVGLTDTLAPETTITAGPPDLDNNPSPAIAFTASEAGASFECALDGALFAPCSPPATYAGLTDGTHTFEVRATDPAGNTDATPAGAIWTIDTSPPDTTISAGVSGSVAAESATFSFSASEDGASFACSLGGAPFTPCTSPTSYDALADGAHTFSVRATDLAGNTDLTPASRLWTVAVPPETTIDSGPSGTIASGSATFSFSSSETGSTFACALDGSAFAPCASPTSYGGLATGSHTFRVQSIDPAGNSDPTPADRAWTVAPQVQLVASGMSFSASTLSASAGTVTISMLNDSTIWHNVAIRGNGVDVSGPVVPKGGISTVTANLAPGTYEFYCSVPGHAEAGMLGTLVVTGEPTTATTSTTPTTTPKTPQGETESKPPATTARPGPTVPPRLRATCTRPTFTLRGVLVSLARDLRSLSVRVQRAKAGSAKTRKRARSYVGKRVSVLLQAKTRVRREGRAADFSRLVVRDRVVLQVRLCKVARRIRLVAGLVAAQPAATDGAGSGQLQLTATAVRFDKTSLSARAGRVTIKMRNNSPIVHDVAIRGNGVDVRGNRVGKGGTSTVTADLAPEKYEFYCSIPGHVEAGMRGTLTVSP